MIQRLRRSSSIVGARTLIHSGSAKKLGLRTLGERSSGTVLKRSTPLSVLPAVGSHLFQESHQSEIDPTGSFGIYS